MNTRSGYFTDVSGLTTFYHSCSCYYAFSIISETHLFLLGFRVGEELLVQMNRRHIECARFASASILLCAPFCTFGKTFN